MKNNIFFLLTFFLLFLFSCQNTLEKPKNLLSKKEMANILTEIYLYKQTPNSFPLSNEASLESYSYILKSKNINNDVFQNSFSYYYVNESDMKDIYDMVIKNLKSKLPKDQLKLLEEKREKEKEEKKLKEKQKK